ncbi:MAG: hypothetical protein AB7G11_02365 [Phycisphaerales bacterium]
MSESILLRIRMAHRINNECVMLLPDDRLPGNALHQAESELARILREEVEVACLSERQRIKELEYAIREHRAQKADDRCIEDDDRLYEALGDGVKCDRRVGDKDAMLVNCKRFIENRCERGGWMSYAELEADRDNWRKEAESARQSERQRIIDWLEARAAEERTWIKRQTSFYVQYEDQGQTMTRVRAFEEVASFLKTLGGDEGKP